MEGQPKISLGVNIMGGGFQSLKGTFGSPKVVVNIPLAEAAHRGFQIAQHLLTLVQAEYPRFKDGKIRRLTIFLRAVGTHIRGGYIWIPKSDVTIFTIPIDPFVYLFEREGGFSSCLDLAAAFWGQELLNSESVRLHHELLECRLRENEAQQEMNSCRECGIPLLHQTTPSDAETCEARVTQKLRESEKCAARLRPQIRLLQGQGLIVDEMLRRLRPYATV